MNRNPSNLLFLLLVILLIPSPLIAGDQLPVVNVASVQEMSDEQLVSLLGSEFEIDERVEFESNFFNYYDIVAGELIRRRSIGSLPLLIAHINNEHTIDYQHPDAMPMASGYGQDSPVRVRDKVRFILYRMLAIEDWREMIGVDAGPVIDRELVTDYFSRNRSAIEQRMTELREKDEAFWQMLKWSEAFDDATGPIPLYPYRPATMNNQHK